MSEISCRKILRYEIGARKRARVHSVAIYLIKNLYNEYLTRVKRTQRLD